MTTLLRAALMLAAPFALWGCVLTPGKFVSRLTVNADRTFAFAYKCEVVAVDASSTMKIAGDSTPGTPTDPSAPQASIASQNAEKPLATSVTEVDAKNREIAAALSKEAGYKSVAYRGKGKFDIDYAISGTLNHSFLFPFNADAQAVFPFVMVEVRQGGTVRVRAPGFSGSQDSGGAMSEFGGMGGGAAEAAKYLDGVFLLDTDGEIVSQNNEDGVKTVGKRRQITWRVTPLTKDPPTTVLRLKS